MLSCIFSCKATKNVVTIYLESERGIDKEERSREKSNKASPSNGQVKMIKVDSISLPKKPKNEFRKEKKKPRLLILNKDEECQYMTWGVAELVLWKREELRWGLGKERCGLRMGNGGSLEERETLRRRAISYFLFPTPKSQCGSWIRLHFCLKRQYFLSNWYCFLCPVGSLGFLPFRFQFPSEEWHVGNQRYNGISY